MNMPPLPQLRPIHPIKLYTPQPGPPPPSTTIVQRESMPIAPARTLLAPQPTVPERVAHMKTQYKDTMISGKPNQHRYYFVNNPQSKDLAGNYADLRLLTHSPPLRLVTLPSGLRNLPQADAPKPVVHYGPVLTRNQRILSIPTITQLPARQTSLQQNNRVQVKTDVQTVPVQTKIRAQHVRIIPQTIHQVPQIVRPIVHPIVQPVPIIQPIMQPVLRNQNQVKIACEKSKNKAMKVKLVPNRFDFDFETRESKILPSRRLESAKLEQRGTVFKVKIKKKSPPKNVILQSPDCETKQPPPKKPQEQPQNEPKKPCYMDKLKIFQDQQPQQESLHKIQLQKEITHPQAFQDQAPKLTRVVLKRHDQQIAFSSAKPLQKNFKKLDRKHNQLYLINGEYHLANQFKPPVRSHIDSKKVLELFQSQIKSKPFESDSIQCQQRLQLGKNEYLLESQPQQQAGNMYLNRSKVADRKEMEIKASQQLLNSRSIFHSGHLRVTQKEKVKEKVVLQPESFRGQDQLLQRDSLPLYLHTVRGSLEKQLELQNNQYVYKDSQQPNSYRLPINYGNQRPKAPLCLVQDQQSISVDQQAYKLGRLHLNTQGPKLNRLDLNQHSSKAQEELNFKSMHIHLNDSRKPLNHSLRLQTDQQLLIQNQLSHKRASIFLNTQQTVKQHQLTLPGQQFSAPQEGVESRSNTIFLNNRQRKPSKIEIRPQETQLKAALVQAPGKQQQLNLSRSNLQRPQGLALQEAVFEQGVQTHRMGTMSINQGRPLARQPQIHILSPQQQILDDQIIQGRTLNLKPHVQPPQRFRLNGVQQQNEKLEQNPQSFRMFVNQRQSTATPFVINKTSQIVSEIIESPRHSSFVNQARLSGQPNEMHLVPKQAILSNQPKTLAQNQQIFKTIVGQRQPASRPFVLNKTSQLVSEIIESPRHSSFVNQARLSGQPSEMHLVPKQVILSNQQKTLYPNQIPLARKKVLNKQPFLTQKKAPQFQRLDLQTANFSEENQIPVRSNTLHLNSDQDRKKKIQIGQKKVYYHGSQSEQPAAQQLNLNIAPYQTTTSQYQQIQDSRHPNRKELTEQAVEPILEEPRTGQPQDRQDAESHYVAEGMEYYEVPQYQYVYPQYYPAYYPSYHYQYYQGSQQAENEEQGEPVLLQQPIQHFANSPLLQMNQPAYPLPVNVPASYAAPVNVAAAYAAPVNVAAGYAAPVAGYAAAGYAAGYPIGYPMPVINQGMYMNRQGLNTEVHTNPQEAQQNKRNRMKIEYQYQFISDDSSQELSIHQEGKKLTLDQFKAKTGQLIEELYEQRWDRVCPKKVHERLLTEVLERVHQGQQLNIQVLVDQAER